MIERYEHEKHYPMLVNWVAAKGMTKPDPDLLSDSGFCVENNAIGFLYKTNSKVAYIENLAGNPLADKEDRSRSIDTLIRVLEASARDNGFKVIFATSELPSIKSRIIEHHNYRGHQSFTFFSKVLGRR